MTEDSMILFDIKFAFLERYQLLKNSRDRLEILKIETYLGLFLIII